MTHPSARVIFRPGQTKYTTDAIPRHHPNPINTNINFNLTLILVVVVNPNNPNHSHYPYTKDGK